MAGPTKEFWEQRFAAGDTPWDRGASSPQLAAWISLGVAEALPDPGAGLRFGIRSCRARAGGVRGHGAGLCRRGDRPHAPAAEGRGVDATLVQADALTWQPDRAVRRGLRADLPVRAVSGPVARVRRPAAPLARAGRAAVRALPPVAAAGRRRGRRPGPALPLRHQCDARTCSRNRAGPGRSRRMRAPRTRAGSPNWRWCSSVAGDGGSGKPAVAKNGYLRLNNSC